MTPIIFPDIELWTTAYLRAALAPYGYTTSNTLVTAKYAERAQVVWVRRDGGAVLDAVREAPRLGVNVFADGPTAQPVIDLARTVSALLLAAADGDPVCRVRQLSGPSEIPDEHPRRYMTFELVVRGTELVAPTP